MQSGVVSMAMASTRRRPRRSLNEPPSSAPSTPADCISDSEAPASQKDAPCWLSRVGR